MRLASQTTGSPVAASSVSTRKVFRQPARPQATEEGGAKGGIEEGGMVGCRSRPCASGAQTLWTSDGGLRDLGSDRLIGAQAVQDGILDDVMIVFGDIREANADAAECGFSVKVDVGRPDLFGRELQDHAVIGFGYQDELVVESRHLAAGDECAA
jgi:hypothetical protein